MNRPIVSVIIPVKEIGYFLIFENLQAFTKQDYIFFEVIVLPNAHTPYDLELLKQYKFLRIIPTGKITRPAEKRDRGVQEARGSIIAFIDDDAYPTETWLEKAVANFEDKKVAAVCGPGVIPPTANRWEKIFDEGLKSPIGSGGYAYRFFPKSPPRYVDDYPSMNFLIQKDIFLKLGGFNSDFWPGEDSKLCNDLVYKEKGKIYYDPDVMIYHHRRNNLKDYLKQHAQYGFHRGAFFAEGDKNSRRPTYLMPTAFVVYLFVLLLTSPLILANRLSIVMAVPGILYAFLLTYQFSSSLINTRDLFLALGSACTLFLTHVVYGIMFMKGFFKKAIQRQGIYD